MTVTLYTTHGEPFTVDDEDAPLVEQFEWWVTQVPNKNGIMNRPVVTKKIFVGRKHRALRLKALIMGRPPVQGVHGICINGYPFCLEKSNLAWVDASTMRHWTARVENQHGYRGISMDPRNGLWYISSLYHRHGYLTAKDAAHGYDEAVRKHFGPWARVNFPRPDDPYPKGLYFPPFTGPLRAEDGSILQVDAEYLSVLSRHRWQPGPESYWTTIGKLPISMTNLILPNQGNGGRAEARWLDGDIRNCTRKNMRWLYGGKSLYIGVSLEYSRWLAVLNHQGQNHRLGLFDAPEEAAYVYDHAAKKIWGSKARLNFPEDI